MKNEEVKKSEEESFSTRIFLKIFKISEKKIHLLYTKLTVIFMLYLFVDCPN